MSAIIQPPVAATNLHSPSAIGDVAPNTIATTNLQVSPSDFASAVVIYSTGLMLGAGVGLIFQAGTIQLNPGNSLLPIGGVTSSFPALKRSATVLQGRLADDSAFCPVQGKLTTDTTATTGLGAGLLAATTNATIVFYDGSGQAYRVPCII